MLIGLLVVTVGVSATGLSGPARPLVFVATVVVVALVVWLSGDRGDREYGPGADDERG